MNILSEVEKVVDSASLTCRKYFQKLGLTENKLGLSCAKLRASLNLFTLTDSYFEFANFAYGWNFGALLLLLWKVWFGMFCSVWNTCFFALYLKNAI